LGKADRAAQVIQQVRSTTSSRWAAYRLELDFIFAKCVHTGLRDRMLASGQKDEFVRILRAQLPEQGLPWIDAAIGIAQDDIVYPYLLGSGGNDGHLDFSVNFAERALSVIGDSPDACAREMLADALEDSALAPLTPGARIGQFSARHAGGVNASTGFESDSLVNPWDYILMIEGSLCFRSAVARRLEFRAGPRTVVLPFAFRAVASGYGSASSLEPSRGELWLPIWDGKIGHAGLVDLFRRGRLDLPSDGHTSHVRSAAVSSEAAAAAVTMGAALGVRNFKRVAFVQRNGLAYVAASSGEVSVPKFGTPMVARISRWLAEWVERIRGTETAKGAEVAELLRGFDDALFAIGSEYQRNAQGFQDLLAALARLEFAVARRSPEYPPPLPYLERGIIDEVDDSTVEHRLAAALASLGGHEERARIRLDIEHVSFNEAKHRLVFDRFHAPMLSPQIENTLSAICSRRVRLARGGKHADGWLFGTRCADIADVVAMLESSAGAPLRKRLATLLIAYSIVEPSHGSPTTSDAWSVPLPAAYAVMKMVIDHPKVGDPRIIGYLCARSPQRALELAMRRARMIEGLPASPRDVRGTSIDDPLWYASVLLVSVERSVRSYRRLLSAALVEAPNDARTARYLDTAFAASGVA